MYVRASIVVDETSGPRIKAYLDEHRPPTGPEIAREADVSRQYVWRVLRGREVPSARVLAACQRLGVPVTDVLSGAGSCPQRKTAIGETPTIPTRESLLKSTRGGTR
jgi:transcriptional regulator with XRE-family HTH domain